MFKSQPLFYKKKNLKSFRKNKTKRPDNKINSLPNDKISHWSKPKAFADKKINVTEKLEFVLGRVENIGEKAENAGYQHFLLFPQCFLKPSV